MSSFSCKPLAVCSAQKELRRTPFCQDKKNPKTLFGRWRVPVKFTGRNDVIFSGPKFSCALRNTRKFFRGLYGTVFGPEKFSGLLRNARQVFLFSLSTHVHTLTLLDVSHKLGVLIIVNKQNCTIDNYIYFKDKLFFYNNWQQYNVLYGTRFSRLLWVMPAENAPNYAGITRCSTSYSTRTI